MIFFVNGKIGLDSPPKGKMYWMPKRLHKEDFIQGAYDFCKDDKPWFLPVDFFFWSGSKARLNAGYKWSLKNLKAVPDNSQTLHFIAHSMGCAFAEGATKGFYEAGFKIGKVIHINCFQAADLEITTMDRDFTVDYQMTDDPLINNIFLKSFFIARPGYITGVDYAIYEPSGIKQFVKKHRGPMGLWGQAFWDHLKSHISR